MGNWWSSTPQRFDYIENRLLQLETKLDKNQDGVVSRSELEEAYHKTQQELELYKNLYLEVNEKYEKLKDEKHLTYTESESYVSDRALTNYIKREMEKSNIPYLYDPAEEQLKKLPMKLFLESMEGLSRRFSFEYAGHKIKFIIEPENNSEDE